MTKMLIVDDDPQIVKLVTHLLKDAYGVITAASGRRDHEKSP